MGGVAAGDGPGEAEGRLAGAFCEEPAGERALGGAVLLFGARDIWFVVGVPVFLSASLGWSGARVGAFMASWVIGYGIVQSLAPAVLRGRAPAGGLAAGLAFVLAAVAAVRRCCSGQGCRRAR